MHIHILGTDRHSTQRYVKSVLYYKSSKLTGGWHLSKERNTIMVNQKNCHILERDKNPNNNLKKQQQKKKQKTARYTQTWLPFTEPES